MKTKHRTWQILSITFLVLILVAPTSASARKRLAKKKITKVMAGKKTTPKQPAADTPRKQASSLFAEANKMVSKGAAMAIEAKNLCLGAMARYRKADSIFPSFKIDLNKGDHLTLNIPLTSRAALEQEQRRLQQIADQRRTKDGSSNYSADIFVTKVNSGGVFQWAKGVGDKGADAGHALALDTKGGLRITGTYSGKVTFGSTTVTSSPDVSGENITQDIFVASAST